MTPELLNLVANLAGLPLHAILLGAVVLLYRDNRKQRDEFIDYLKESAKHGDVAAQNVIDKRSNGRS